MGAPAWKRRGRALRLLWRMDSGTLFPFPVALPQFGIGEHPEATEVAIQFQQQQAGSVPGEARNGDSGDLSSKGFPRTSMDSQEKSPRPGWGEIQGGWKKTPGALPEFGERALHLEYQAAITSNGEACRGKATFDSLPQALQYRGIQGFSRSLSRRQDDEAGKGKGGRLARQREEPGSQEVRFAFLGAWGTDSQREGS